MAKHFLDLKTYSRLDLFEYFTAMRDPFLTVTCQVDITRHYRQVQEKSYPVFLSFLYVLTRAANSIPTFRRRIANEGKDIAEYDECPASYTLSKPNGDYCYCALRTDLPYAEFLPYALKRKTEALENPSLDDGEDPDEFFYESCIPWINYESLEGPKHKPYFSVPSFTWGRYKFEEKPLRGVGGIEWREVVTVPVTVMVHHALMDGRDVALFYQALEKGLSEDL